MPKHIAVFHQLGLVTVWEANFIIAVSSVDSTASFATVSYTIDILKAKVPIWEKKQRVLLATNDKVTWFFTALKFKLANLSLNAVRFFFSRS